MMMIMVELDPPKRRTKLKIDTTDSSLVQLNFSIFLFIRIVAAVTPVLTMEHAWWGTLTKDTAVSVHLVLLEKTARKVNFKIFI